VHGRQDEAFDVGDVEMLHDALKITIANGKLFKTNCYTPSKKATIKV
jgi:hypothetical protein